MCRRKVAHNCFSFRLFKGDIVKLEAHGNTNKTISRDVRLLLSELPGTFKHLSSGYTGIKGPSAIAAAMLLGRRRFWTALGNPGAAGNSICFSTQFITPVAQMVNG